jgi:hypothetical protein
MAERATVAAPAAAVDRRPGPRAVISVRRTAGTLVRSAVLLTVAAVIVIPIA